ncbi:MAG: anaerobic ribonucleoside-triphosphate reductase activating protein [Spirochaetes bacterium]|nr:anaerobic ribonucleoside-triphosphate reductase activating protein [Spirochaetota bacterium]
MRIGGFQNFSLNEFPGKISAVVFCRGCNFRCPYCHNPELVDPARYTPLWPEDRVIGELAARRGRLQGVVITGGEPTLQEDLEPFIRKVRGLGFAVKLDTNGSDPDALERLLSAGLLDHVGLDVKAPLSKYVALTRADISPNTITRSISTVLASGVDHEIRTTWLPSLLGRNDLLEIAGMVRGCRSWAIQRFVPSKTLDPAVLSERPPDDSQMSEIRSAVEALGINCQVR